MFSERLKRPSSVRLSVALMIGFAVTVALSIAFAPDAAAKKKKKQRPPAFNVVRCPTGGSSTECDGTSSSDYLLGRDATYDHIKGGDGNDGKCGGDAWEDDSPMSNDYYLVSVKDFNSVGISSLGIQDAGGSFDTLDLSRFYKSTDFAFSMLCTNLHMGGPGVNDVDIYNFFTTDSIDFFRFSDGALTAQQVKDMIS